MHKRKEGQDHISWSRLWLLSWYLDRDQPLGSVFPQHSTPQPWEYTESLGMKGSVSKQKGPYLCSPSYQRPFQILRPFLWFVTRHLPFSSHDWGPPPKVENCGMLFQKANSWLDKALNGLWSLLGACTVFSTFRAISTHAEARMWRVSERREGEKGRRRIKKREKTKGWWKWGERDCNSSGKSVWGLVKWSSNPCEYLLSLEKLLELCLNFLPCKMDILLFSSSSIMRGYIKSTSHSTQNIRTK